MHFNKSGMFSYWVLTFNGIMWTHPIKNLTKKWRKIPTSSLNMFQKSGFCVPTQSATKSYYTHNLPIAKVFNLYGQKIIFASSHWPVSNETKFMHWHTYILIFSNINPGRFYSGVWSFKLYKIMSYTFRIWCNCCCFRTTCIS